MLVSVVINITHISSYSCKYSKLIKGIISYKKHTLNFIIKKQNINSPFELIVSDKYSQFNIQTFNQFIHYKDYKNKKIFKWIASNYKYIFGLFFHGV